MNKEPNDKKLVTAPPYTVSPSFYYDLGNESSRGETQEFSLRDSLTIIFKYKYKILSIFLLAIACAYVGYGFIPVRYEADSVLMLRYGREYAAPNVSDEQTPLRMGLSEIANSEVAILSSRDLKEAVIGKIGAERLVPRSSLSGSPDTPIETAIVMMDKNLLISSSKAGNLITISYRSEDPKLAAEVVNTLVNSYQEKRLQVLNDPKPGLFLENKVSSFYKRLRDSEQKLETFKQSNRIYAFEDQRSTLLQNRESLNAAINTAQAHMQELREKLAVLENETKTVSMTLPNGSDANNDVELQLLTLQRKEQELLSKYKENNPLIASVREEMRTVKEFMDKHKKDPKVATNSAYQDLQKDIITTKAELASIEAGTAQQKLQLEALDKEIQELDLHENYVHDMRRQLAADEQMYQAYSKKLEEARISDDMDRQKMTSINVIEKASPPILPISPSKPLVFFLGVAAILGLGGGTVLAFLLESLGQGLISPEKTEKKLNLPVLLVIPKDVTKFVNSFSGTGIEQSAHHAS